MRYLKKYGFSTPEDMVELLSEYLQEFFDKFNISDINLHNSGRIDGIKWRIENSPTENKEIKIPHILILNYRDGRRTKFINKYNLLKYLLDISPLLENRIGCGIIINKMNAYNKLIYKDNLGKNLSSEEYIAEEIWSISITINPTLSIYRKMLGNSITKEDKKNWIKFIILSLYTNRNGINNNIRLLLSPYKSIVEELRSESKLFNEIYLKKI